MTPFLNRSPWHQMALPLMWATAVAALLLLANSQSLYGPMLSQKALGFGQMLLLLAYNFPAVLVMALPMGFTYAVLDTLGRWVAVPGERPTMPRTISTGALIAGAMGVAAALGLAALLLNETLVPRANRASLTYARQILGAPAPESRLPVEMSLGELRQRAAEAAPDSEEGRALQAQAQLRLALPSSYVFLGLVAACMSVWLKRWCRYPSVPLAVVLSLTWAIGLLACRRLVETGALSPGSAIWIPNLAFGAIGLLLLPLALRRPLPAAEPLFERDPPPEPEWRKKKGRR